MRNFMSKQAHQYDVVERKLVFGIPEWLFAILFFAAWFLLLS